MDPVNFETVEYKRGEIEYNHGVVLILESGYYSFTASLASLYTKSDASEYIITSIMTVTERGNNEVASGVKYMNFRASVNNFKYCILVMIMTPLQ